MTLWDAGEFSTAARTLSIPHPPGTPLYVVLGHVWGLVVAVGDYAWRLNLMSATFSAAGAGCLFLVAHRVLSDEPARVRTGGAAAAAALSAFSFTAWQNSNEAEVYMLATLSIAAVCWLCLRWRDARGGGRAPHYLLLIAYLEALSIGNHLMTLLVGPAVSAFLFHVLRSSPAADPAERRIEWSEWTALSAVWVLLVAVGLGSTPLLVLGGLLCAAALVHAATARAVPFPLAALAVAAVGVSTYGFLYVRSALDPVLDMGDPETWRRLVGVIRREQYPPRSLLDNPIFPSGPDNPGRTPLLFSQQLVNYLLYFGWQWARSLGTAGLAVTGLFATLGGAGARELARRDRSAAWLLGTLWLVTGLGMVVYMNFRPGFSLFWGHYPEADAHEPRERDYFFTMSFQVWGVFAALGLVAVARRLRAWALAAALLPFAFNFSAASRRHGPDATLARDFAYNMLQSVEPHGILFTYGDNDTYPLWYAQEVEGVRQDVVNLNLSLANMDWYLRHLRDRPIRTYDPAHGPPIYRAAPPSVPPVLDVPDATIAALRPFQLERDVTFHAGALALPLRRGQALLVRDQVILLVLQQQLASDGPRRPITFGISSGRGAWLGLDAHLVLQGLVFTLTPGRAETLRGLRPGIQGPPVDVARTEYLVDQVFRWGELIARDTLVLEPAARQVVTSLAAPLLELGQAYALRRDQSRALAYFRRAYHLSPSAPLAALIAQIEREGLESVLPPDSEPRARP